jgi:iron complex outermembrane receptor protein
MKKLITVFLLIAYITIAYAQTGIIKGTISNNGELLPGATVIVKSDPSKGTLTDIDGNYLIKLPYGKYTLIFSYVGFEKQEREVNLNQKSITIDIKLSTQMLDEVEIVADVARARSTPVAFTNIRPSKIAEELAAQDLPMVLNSTPGVYATQQGGGDGDARITIRGFSQRNVAVMLDGVPVNDMENGWVYWSNWFGLDAVTRNIQVQRGLGASKLGIPSVGGTMNILTSGIENKFSANINHQVTDYGLNRTTFGVTSGKLKGDWGFTMAGSYKKGTGWAEMTNTEGYFYYLKIQKRIKNHNISISGYGAPQQHAQRPYKVRMLTLDADYALNYVGDTSTFNSPEQIDKGVKYNAHWGYLDRWSLNSSGDTIFNGREKVSGKLNYYHKPQFTIKDTWSVSDKLYISNLVYLSIGKGGGTGIEGEKITDDGYIDFQQMYDNNKRVNPFGTNNAGSYIKSSINNHYWLGYLGFIDYQYNSELNLSGGLDLRMYKAEHYREVYDLLGGQFMYNKQGQDPINHSSLKLEKTVGDKIDYFREGFVRWAGGFAQAEYETANWTAFVSGSLSAQAFQQVDRFGRKIVELSDTSFTVGLEYDAINNQIVHDSVVYNGVTYNINSDEAKYNTTDWATFIGYTIKGGFNYNFTENINAFINLGHISKAPRFSNVYDVDNTPYTDPKNELIYAIELGGSYTSETFSMNINPYFTYWHNKPIDRAPSVMIDGEVYKVNLQGIGARHMGIEIDFAYQPIDKIKFQGFLP